MAAIMGSNIDFGDNVYIEGLGYMPTEMYAQHLRMQGLEPNEAQSEYLTVQEYLGKGGFRNAVNPIENLDLSNIDAMASDEKVVIKAGTVFNNAEIKGYGVKVESNPINEFDNGIRQIMWDDFIITDVISRNAEDYAPFATYKNIDGFEVKNGTRVNIRIVKDVVVNVSSQQTIYNINSDKLNDVKETIKDPNKDLIPGIKDEYLIVGTIIAVILLV